MSCGLFVDVKDLSMLAPVCWNARFINVYI